MSPLDEFDDEFEEFDEFDRPFLGSGAAVSTTPPAPAGGDPDDAEDGTGVRAYLLTGGRTGGGAAGIAMETTAVVTPLGASVAASRSLAFELGQVLDSCAEARSVAEVAALVGIPLGVAQVLVGDLVARELLITTSTAKSLAFDVSFIERLINGVAAL
ncbi:hypothetical protein FHR75_003017 [Kineococcus radiotolerans]|uniref:DUF742 domain-containing protein n=2 Tax=Kineococcus radiotolerans TaxID=131568 RepID=A6WES0_KINRD|nr:DUF742 domain-containing protein [Kineococcus radiotolerans]ABS05309.1 hypothetical protein Krad_3846 [Kineococcus radiotolerans SRS30216 = ATCC BAA-149]MBB2902186.1 hypothetical protein [Kineococcus radiotolerans]